MTLKVTTEVTTPRNNIMQRVLSTMLGVGFGPTLVCTKGILSPADSTSYPRIDSDKGASVNRLGAQKRTDIPSRVTTSATTDRFLYSSKSVEAE